jgi:hypothetical protein
VDQWCFVSPGVRLLHPVLYTPLYILTPHPLPTSNQSLPTSPTNTPPTQLVCFSYNNFYPYPLFELLSYTQRVLLFAASALMMAGSTAAIRQLYKAVNGGGSGVKVV